MEIELHELSGPVDPKVYPLASDGSLAPNPLTGPHFFRATGEIRPAKKGEWIISGAIPEVYYCANDQSTADHLAEPLKMTTVNGLPYRLVL